MSTLPKRLIERASATPNKVAWRQFRLGVWNETTWSAMHREAAAIGGGLAALGIGKGDVVAVVAGNSVVAIACELGAQGVGAVAAVLSPDLAPSTVRAALEMVSAKAVVVGDQEQFDKVEAANVGSVQSIVVIDARGFRHIEVAGRPDADRILTIEQLKNRSGDSGSWDAKAGAVHSTDPAAILCRVNGPSKEVEAIRHTHDGLLAHAATFSSSVAASEHDVVSVQRSLADPVEHALSVVGPIALGLTANMAESNFSVQSLRQVQPTLVSANTVLLRATAGQVKDRLGRARGLKGIAARKGLVDRPLRTSAAVIPKLSPTRTTGIAAAVLAFLFLLVTVSLNDWLRLFVVLAIALAAALVTVFAGWSGVGAARRNVGLSRCRAIVDDASLSTATDPAVGWLLGTFGVPVVAVARADGEEVGRIRSEVLA